MKETKKKRITRTKSGPTETRMSRVKAPTDLSIGSDRAIPDSTSVVDRRLDAVNKDEDKKAIARIPIGSFPIPLALSFSRPARSGSRVYPTIKPDTPANRGGLSRLDA